MKKNYALKISVFLTAFMMSFAMLAQVQKTLIVVGGNVDQPNAEDQVMIDSLEKWVTDVYYLHMDEFNNAIIEELYEEDGYGAEGVIISESINSASVGNFGLDEYPVPSIVLEGVFTGDQSSTEKWPLLLEDGGIWGYGTPEYVDVQWKIVETQHYITENFSNGDIINYAPEEGRGVPYIHGVAVPHQILAVAARENGGNDVPDFVQDEAIAMAELPDQGILYMNVAYTYLAVGTEEFYDILHRGVEYMFDAYADNTSAREISSDNLKLQVYPNPARDKVTVRYSARDKGKASISVINLAGKEVYQKREDAVFGINASKIDAHQFDKGIYMVRVCINDQVSHQKLFVE